MKMADITTFPTIQNVQYSGNSPMEFTATEAITKGMAVGFAGTGIASSVIPLDGGATEFPVGIATSSAAAGAKVLVALDGAICYVANSDDTTAIEAGEYITSYNGTIEGTVVALTVDPAVAQLLIGQAISEIAADGVGLMQIKAIPV